MPVIEVKTVKNKTKGSLGSFKPDLIAANESVILVVECKPTFSAADVTKLRELQSSAERRQNLAEEIMQRGILHRHDIAAHNWRDIDARFHFAVSYHGSVVDLDDILVICINTEGSGVCISAGNPSQTHVFAKTTCCQQPRLLPHQLPRVSRRIWLRAAQQVEEQRYPSGHAPA